MKITLLKDVTGVGQKGSVVDVRDGFGRNYLVRYGFAKLSSAGDLAQAVKRDELIKKKAAQRKETEVLLAEKLAGYTLTFSRKTNERGVLFAAVGARDVLSTLRKNGFEGLMEENISGLPIKTQGEHPISITFPYIEKIINLRVVIEAL